MKILCRKTSKFYFRLRSKFLRRRKLSLKARRRHPRPAPWQLFLENPIGTGSFTLIDGQSSRLPLSLVVAQPREFRVLLLCVSEI